MTNENLGQESALHRTQRESQDYLQQVQESIIEAHESIAKYLIDQVEQPNSGDNVRCAWAISKSIEVQTHTQFALLSAITALRLEIAAFREDYQKSPLKRD